MPPYPTPYDILAAISFIQGTLTLVAALVAAIWSVTEQARANRQLVTNLQDKIDQIKDRYSKHESQAGLGTTNSFLDELNEESKKLVVIKNSGPFDHWIHRDSKASDLAKISDRIDFILLDFHLIDIRDIILVEIRNQINPQTGHSARQEQRT